MASSNESNEYLFLGIDTGGTFTDFVALERAQNASASDSRLTTHKVLSTPDDPSRAILQGVHEMGLDTRIQQGTVLIIHGTTVATNAALEKKGVKTAYVTNKGFKDVLTIGRQTRKALYNLTPEPEAPPVPDNLCFEIDCRRTFDNQPLSSLTANALDTLTEQIKQAAPEAVAINLLYSYLDPGDEIEIANALSPYCHVTRSSFILPQDGEYERGITTWLSAWLGPLVNTYLTHLTTSMSPSPLSVMQSSGGTIDAQSASLRAANLLLSGPAGGLAAARFLGQQIGCEKLLTFDMGGTSTDVALIDGEIGITQQGEIAGYPVGVPMVNMHTIGAGGGSLAWLDEGGMLQVGPQSAGAQPGPACYGQGGDQVTVTDANVFLGRLPEDSRLGGTLSLDRQANRNAVGRLAESVGLAPADLAQGVIEIANEHMTAALRKISINQGHDPADFTLCCFGGAGGLHVCAIADALEMTRAIVPIHSGVLSALGMIVAPKERRLGQSLLVPLLKADGAEVRRTLFDLKKLAGKELQNERCAVEQISYGYEVALRYSGQRFTLKIPLSGEDMNDTEIHRLERTFHTRHEELFGHRMNRPVELVSIHVHASLPPDVDGLPENEGSPDEARQSRSAHHVSDDNPVCVSRASLPTGITQSGPAILTDHTSTVYVEDGWSVTKDRWGNLRLERHP